MFTPGGCEVIEETCYLSLAQGSASHMEVAYCVSEVKLRHFAMKVNVSAWSWLQTEKN